MIGTNALLYSVSSVSDRYQEQKYVSMASLLMFEILAVGIPVMVAVGDNPSAMYIVLTGVIALDDIGKVFKICLQRAMICRCVVSTN